MTPNNASMSVSSHPSSSSSGYVKTVENNKEIYRKFRQQLTKDDLESYASRIAKLSQFLSGSKAYYGEAREDVRPKWLFLKFPMSLTL